MANDLPQTKADVENKRLQQDKVLLRGALQLVMDEYREGYGLRCVEQVKEVLELTK